jgi:hypothetical protein
MQATTQNLVIIILSFALLAIGVISFIRSRVNPGPLARLRRQAGKAKNRVPTFQCPPPPPPPLAEDQLHRLEKSDIPEKEPTKPNFKSIAMNKNLQFILTVNTIIVVFILTKYFNILYLQVIFEVFGAISMVFLSKHLIHEKS